MRRRDAAGEGVHDHRRARASEFFDEVTMKVETFCKYRAMPKLTPERREALDASIDAVHRIAIELASWPRETRAAQYALVRRRFAESIKTFGLQGDTADRWLDNVMGMIQTVVGDIDESGGADGGTA